MSSIGKVHLNGSTVLSLNDRFTIMQRQPPAPTPRPRARSRSRSRSRLLPQMNASNAAAAAAASIAPISPRLSLRNRNLVHQLDQRHKMRIALKLKRKSMKPARKPQNVIGVRGRRRLVRPSAALINTTTGTRKRVRRSQSVAKQIATIKADLIKNVKRVRRLTKTNSKLNITEQLGAGGARGRPRLRRNNAPIGERATSRSRGRSASRNRANLTRTNLTRTNSKQNLRGRSASRQRTGAPIRLNRSNSRLNLNMNNRGGGGANNAAQGAPNNGRRQRTRSQSRSNVRKNASLNARLGVKRQNVNSPKQRRQQNNNNRQGVRNVQRGRITKRPKPNARNQIGNGAQQQLQQQQRGRSRSRVRQNVAAPGRNRSRNNNNNIGHQGGGNQQQRGTNRPRNQQPKRGGQQARGRSQKKIVRREPPKSKEQLDAELDQYMVSTKSSLDQEMSLYTN